MGLAALPQYVARESMASGRLQAVLTNHSLPSQEMHAVFPSPKLVPSKVRSFCDFLSHRFDGRWWEER